MDGVVGVLGERVLLRHVAQQVKKHVPVLAIIPHHNMGGARALGQQLKQFHVIPVRVPSMAVGVITDNGVYVQQRHVVRQVKKRVPELAIIPSRSMGGARALGQQPKRLFVKRRRVQSMEAGVITGTCFYPDYAVKARFSL